MSSRHNSMGLNVEGAVGRARDQLSKAIVLLKRRTDGGHESDIHDVRKRIKKARALILLIRGAVGRKAVAKVDRRLREAARPTSAIRDASVMIDTLDALAARLDDPAQNGAFAHVRVALIEHRDRVALDPTLSGDSLARSSKALRQARRRLAGWDRGSLDDLPIGEYRRAYRRGRHAFRAASDDPSPEALHELRKRVKALVYQVDALEVDPAGPVARISRLARLLAEELGEVHDLDVLREFLAFMEEATPILRPLDRRRLDLRRAALLRAGVVYRDRPRAFVRMLETALQELEVAPFEK